MFTGIIEATGVVATLASKADGLRIHINSGKLDLSDVKLGDSIAVNGVCLTAVDLPGDGFWADVSSETLQRTSLSGLRVGSGVNLEKAMAVGDRFGGHMVSGHVDGIGQIVSRKDEGRFVRFKVRAPEQLARYIAEKGSITVDGTSLTVNGVEGGDFVLTIVPHTIQETIISEYAVGTRVNLEVDLVARYLERLLQHIDKDKASPVTMEKLAQYGFIK